MLINSWAVLRPNGKLQKYKHKRELNKDEIAIRVTHCGLNPGDIFILENKWNATRYPAIGGSETVGIISKIGRAVKNLRIGDRVGIGYQHDACFKCEYCKAGFVQYCEEQRNTELGSYGGFSDLMIANSNFVFKIPDNISSKEAAPFMCSGLAVYSGIKRAKLKENSKVGVIGLGGLGHLVVQFLSKMGHKTSVFSHTKSKKNLAYKLGADNFIYSKEISNDLNRSFDLIISTVYKNLKLNNFLHLLKPDGKLCIVGLPFKKPSFQVANLADYAGKTIYGSYIGSIKETKEMLKFCSQNGVKAFVETMPMAKITSAIKYVKTGKPRFRVVLTN